MILAGRATERPPCHQELKWSSVVIPEPWMRETRPMGARVALYPGAPLNLALLGLRPTPGPPSAARDRTATEGISLLVG